MAQQSCRLAGLCARAEAAACQRIEWDAVRQAATLAREQHALLWLWRLQFGFGRWRWRRNRGPCLLACTLAAAAAALADRLAAAAAAAAQHNTTHNNNSRLFTNPARGCNHALSDPVRAPSRSLTSGSSPLPGRSIDRQETKGSRSVWRPAGGSERVRDPCASQRGKRVRAKRKHTHTHK